MDPGVVIPAASTSDPLSVYFPLVVDIDLLLAGRNVLDSVADERPDGLPLTEPLLDDFGGGALHDGLPLVPATCIWPVTSPVTNDAPLFVEDPELYHDSGAHGLGVHARKLRHVDGGMSESPTCWHNCNTKKTSKTEGTDPKEGYD